MCVYSRYTRVYIHKYVYYHDLWRYEIMIKLFFARPFAEALEEALTGGGGKERLVQERPGAAGFRPWPGVVNIPNRLINFQIYPLVMVI